MAFPSSPINGQTTTTNNINYIYNSTLGVWNRVATTITLSSGTVGGTAASGTGTTTTFVIQNFTQSTGTNSGALQVYGGAGIGGNLNVGGNIVGGGVRATTTSTPPSNPTIGDIWYQQGTDIVFRYENDGTTTSNYWIDIAGPTVVVSSSTVSGSSGGGTFNGGNVANATTFSNTVSMSTTLIVGSGNTNTGTTVSFEVLGTDAILLPTGTTAQRPSAPIPGMMRYNSSTTAIEAYLSGNWIQVAIGTYNISYFVLGGGGGGSGGAPGTKWASAGAGGAARSGTQPVLPGTVYTITVGTGGAGSGSGGVNGTAGTTSSISTVVSVSGGGGGNAGSGVGGSNQDYTGGPSISTQAGGGAGAGGNGGVGANMNGGIGVTTAITGSSQYIGGGGAGYDGSTYGTSTASGGAYSSSAIGSNTGAGGGGLGGNGSSGVVYIAYQNLTQRANGGSVSSYTTGTVTYWVHTFTGSSTFTA